MKFTSPIRNDFEAVSTPATREPLPQRRRRRRDRRVVLRLRVTANRPAIGEHIGMEQIRRRRSRAVVKSRAHHPIGQFQHRGMPRPDRLQTAGPRLGKERVFGNAERLRRHRRRLRGRAVLDNRFRQN